MLEGDLPPREGTAPNVDFSDETKKIIVEVGSSREEVTIAEAAALIGKIAAMIEVVAANG